MLSDMNQTRNNKTAEIVEEYMSSLQELTANSKPHINMLTILAEEYIEFASAIVEAVEAHLQKVRNEIKLPVLYLIDSIIKNVNKEYVNLFAKNIVHTFCNVFEKVDQMTRAKMWKLRLTWNDIFPSNKLISLDYRAHNIDPEWPATGHNKNVSSKAIIHVNPKFLSRQKEPPPPVSTSVNFTEPVSEQQMREELLKKQQELLKLKHQKQLLQQHKKRFERHHILVKPEFIASDGTLKKPIVTTVPCDTLNSVENQQSTLIDSSSSTSEQKSDSKEQPSSGIPTALQNGDVLEEKSKASQDSSLVKASSPVKSRVNDEIINPSENEKEKENADLSLKLNDNKCLENERNQRSNSNSQKQSEKKEPRNSSEHSPSKSSSARASSSSFTTSANKQQLTSSSSNVSSSSSSTARKSSSSRNKSHNETSSSSSSPHKKSSKSRKRNRSPADRHHRRDSRDRRHHHHHHHHHRHHSSPKIGLDEEEQLGGSLIVSPPQPSANSGHKDPRQRRDSNSSAGRTCRESNSPSSESTREDTKRHDSTGSTDEYLKTALVASSVTSATASLDSKEDLDLRVLPMTSNKRAPTDVLQGPDSKKSKDEKFDDLFGKEDVDLRLFAPAPQSIAALQPPTPPPPVISNDKDGWAKFKTPSKTSDSRSESNRTSDSGRSVSERNRDRSSRTKLYNKPQDNDFKDRRRSGRDYERNSDRNIEIIMKQAAEQLNQGNITKSQYNKLIQEVLHMSEDQKLKAAQRKERESKIWDRNDGKNMRPKEHNMHPRAPGGPRWQQPWHQPWAHPPSPFQGHFRPEFRAIGPWQSHPRLFGGPMRADFHQFHAGFNPRLGPPMGPNGHLILPNNAINPMTGANMNPMGGPIGHMPPGMMLGPIIQPKRPNAGDESWSGASNNNNDTNKLNDVDEVSSSSDELPVADPKLLEEIAKDTMRSINIDNVPREIRYYGHTGVIFMHWDDPRDIGFQNGARRISVDGKEAVVCSFNDDYREFTHDGQVHRIKLGAPTRELYINDKWYQCYFGGQPIMVELGNKKVSVKLEGPPPQVKIGITKRSDLVVGKINLIINARSMVPVFLDSKPQMFNIENKPCTLEFIDSLQTVLLNGRPFKVEFGGLPKPVFVGGKKHFIRFSVLPRGFRAGFVKITGMKGEQPKELPPPVTAASDKMQKTQIESSNPMQAVPSPVEPDSTSQDGLDHSYTSKSDLQLDVLSSVVPSAMAPSSGLSYQAEPVENPVAPVPTVTLPLNLNELFQRLVETGIVSNLNETKKPEEEEEKKEPEIIPVSFDKPETLKIRQPAMVTVLYSGIQCSSCGARFAPEMATRYSHHLDWHFRQNRKERDSSRKAHSRLWYYDVSDWIQFEEIEDLEDRAQSWFETEKQSMEIENAAAEELFAETEQPSVCTGSEEDSCCQVCREAFEQFYNDEKEEWHLRPAITYENKNFHPLCLEDHKEKLFARAAENPALSLDALEVPEKNNNIQNEDAASENLEIKKEDDKEEEKDEESIENEIVPEAKDVLEDLLTKIEETTEQKIEETSSIIATGQLTQELEKTETIVETNSNTENEKVDAEVDKENPENLNTQTEVKEPESVKEDDSIELDQELQESTVESTEIDSTQVEVKSTIDGNVELETTTAIPISQSKIIINITKPLGSPKEKEIKDEKEVTEEKPIKEEVTVPLQPASIKPLLRDRNLSVLPPIEKGEELSALCSIM